MSSDLTFNKMLGALLATGLTIVGLNELTAIVFKSEPAAKQGYAVAIQEDAAGGGGAEAADAIPDWGTVLPAASVTAGAQVATKCQSCHNLEKGGPNLIGPNLYGVLGRKPGSHPGFAYSSSVMDFSGKMPAWDYDHLYEFLKGPQAYISGTKMSFVGLKKADDRVNVIAYLRTLNDAPPPIPAPNPKVAAPAAPADASSAPAASDAAPAASDAPAAAK